MPIKESNLASEQADGKQHDHIAGFESQIPIEPFKNTGHAFDTPTHEGTSVMVDGKNVDDSKTEMPQNADADIHQVDNVFISVNMKDDKNHWVLALLSFMDKHLYVYDSSRASGYDADVKAEIDMLTSLLPIYLEMNDFYCDK
ncbi:hypothetical protein RND71_035578 [Anisodus tanguticus]|uniref:Ubiquitin-like protease family profile domain-containing protein n=1 Tax=Anisodus tanguticus TaxID=243964 RepID=A0AAE1R7A1_9SOLA|nr:hypothetical protein RND71_035578 [Anisodus tanguticus]